MDVIALLWEAKERNASDLHLFVSSSPMVRVNGSLDVLRDFPPLTAEDMSEALCQIATADQRREFYRTLELDFGHTLADGTRIRCNVAQQRGVMSMALRLLPPRIPTIDELGLPRICKELVMLPRGLIVVSGPTGSGKTTTLAAMIEYLNKSRTRHIVTVEDPIEYFHENVKSGITQRQLGNDTLSFAQALKHILRHDPDVILVGEMRDTETAASVLSLAETGHLILTTGHAPYAPQTVERIIDLFPPAERYLAQARLGSLLSAVLCQTLLPRADGKGRVVAVEIMLGLSAVRNLIREGKISQLFNVIRTYREAGMISLDEALAELYIKQLISGETLLEYCNDRQEVERLISTAVDHEIQPFPALRGRT